MSQIKKRFLKLGTGTDQLNARDLNANYTPASYTPVAVGAEANTQISAHLKGINNALAAVSSSAGDLPETSFSAANNQAAAANVTGFAFANGTVRSFRALVSVSISATSSLYEQFTIDGIQKSASWEISTTSVGDNSGVVFSITSAGQIQYTSGNVSGFTSDTIKFRASTTTV